MGRTIKIVKMTTKTVPAKRMKGMNQMTKMKTKRIRTAMTRVRLGRSSKRSDKERSTLHRREDVLKRNGKISGKEEKYFALSLKSIRKKRKGNIGNYYLSPDIKGRHAPVYRPLAAPVLWAPRKHWTD
jgi:hypothetical protein